MRVTLPYPPSANRYWRHNRGHIHRSDEATEYIEAVGWICQHMGIAPSTGPVRLTLNVYRPMRRGDLDNTLKVAIDSLRRYLYNDDDQVVELHAYRHDDKANPRVEVECVPA